MKERAEEQMGLFDFLKSERGQKRRAAELVGLETGLFQQCPVCREVTEKQAPEALLEQTLRLAERWVQEQDARVSVFRGQSAELKGLIREIRKRSEFTCMCERT